MAALNVADYLKLAALLRDAPHGFVSSTYDAEADTLYVNFTRPIRATDSELTDDDVILRYEGDEVVGLTILHASTR